MKHITVKGFYLPRLAIVNVYPSGAPWAESEYLVRTDQLRQFIRERRPCFVYFGRRHYRR